MSANPRLWCPANFSRSLRMFPQFWGFSLQFPRGPEHLVDLQERRPLLHLLLVQRGGLGPFQPATDGRMEDDCRDWAVTAMVTGAFFRWTC